MTEPTIDELLVAAEPTEPRPLAGLIERLAAEHRLRGARRDGRAIGAAGLAGVDVRGVTNDSRDVRDGSLFVAIPGLHADGHDFVAAAAAAGASAAIVDRAVPEVAIPQLVVAETRTALASAAAWWYGDPSHDLAVVGITGTDGKTTTCFLAVAALEAAGIRTGMTGTAATRIGGVQTANEAHATTPEAPDLQLALRAMAGAGDTAAVIETTSHGLALGRVDAVAYDVAILTNLTHEHLELHGTWEAYRDAKLKLFEKLERRVAAGASTAGIKPHDWPASGIVNADDPSASAFIGVAQEARARILTYGTDPTADVRATRVEEDQRRLRIAYDAPSGSAIVDLRLVGRFNVHNALAVVALGEAVGLDPAAVREGLASVPVVPGRMERVELGQPFGVIVDFAHSPASLQTVLDLLAPLAASRGGGLIAVFGSAGERDTAKRPLMGRIAGERARVVVVTDEDPRGEDRETILDEIARGAEAAGKRRDHDLLVIADRRTAIEAALERARPGDIVLLAGKGHEQAIIGPDGPVPWNERGEAEAALHRAGYG
jgi:UDP-N-acetylmuramoyl-L-alanyl-D-glutamate--2,6-diaminopimelate ligase